MEIIIDIMDIEILKLKKIIDLDVWDRNGLREKMC